MIHWLPLWEIILNSFVAGASYVTVDGPLETTREHDAPPRQHILDMVEASARQEGVNVSK